MKTMGIQPVHERALDRRLSGLADPVIPPELVARMIAEIPWLPQEQPDGASVLTGSRRSPEAVMAVIAANAAGDDFGRRVGWASLVAGLAACLLAVLILSPPGAERGAAPTAQVASPHAQEPLSISAAALAPAPDTPRRLAQLAPASRPRLVRSRLAQPAPSPSDDRPVAPAAAAEPQLAAAQAPSTRARSAPIEIDAPNDRIAVAQVAGPPAPSGVNDEIGPDDGTAIPAPSAMGPRAPTGMGFGGMGTVGGETQGFPGGRR